MAAPVVRLRRSATEGAVPTTAQLALGEVAINTYDGKIFLKKDQSGTESIVEVLSDSITEFRILDDISSGFNGVTTNFTLSYNSGTNFVNTEITTPARLLISVGGTIQEPSATRGFQLSGGTDATTDPIVISFVTAPQAGQTFWGIAFGASAAPTTGGISEELAIAYAIAL